MATVKLFRPSNQLQTEYYAKPASTAFAADTLVSANADATSNTFVATTATSPAILGVLRKTIASTDSDYASETKVPVDIDPGGIYEFTVGNGTADANDEQGFIDVDDTAPASEVDVAASTEDHIFVTAFVSGTKVRGKIVTYAHVVPPVHAS